MRQIVYILLLLTVLTTRLFAQDTNAVWLKNIDTLDFKIVCNKKAIPTDLLKYIEVDKLKEIANPNEKFISGCVGSFDIPHKRINWVAKDKKNHFVVSISFGGRAHRTCFYYVDNDGKKTNINELYFGNSYASLTALTFGSTTNKIRTKEFKFLEYDPPTVDN